MKLTQNHSAISGIVNKCLVPPRFYHERVFPGFAAEGIDCSFTKCPKNHDTNTFSGGKSVIFPMKCTVSEQ